MRRWDKGQRARIQDRSILFGREPNGGSKRVYLTGENGEKRTMSGKVGSFGSPVVKKVFRKSLWKTTL